jgi:hypothetical protein
MRPVWLMASMSLSKPFAAPLNRTSTTSRRSLPLTLVKYRVVASVVNEVDRKLGRPEQAPSNQEAAHGKPTIARVIERAEVSCLDGVRIRTSDTPSTPLIVRVAGIVSLPQIWPVADRHEPLQIDRQQLPSEAQRERGAAQLVRQSDEDLFNVDSILVDWGRPAVLA